MKLAVTSQGNNLQSPLDPRFGRAKWVWLSYWTLTVKPRGQTYSAGEVLVRLQAPIDH
jgi:hypothetical protein